MDKNFGSKEGGIYEMRARNEIVIVIVKSNFLDNSI